MGSNETEEAINFLLKDYAIQKKTREKTVEVLEGILDLAEENYSALYRDYVSSLWIEHKSDTLKKLGLYETLVSNVKEVKNVGRSECRSSKYKKNEEIIGRKKQVDAVVWKDITQEQGVTGDGVGGYASDDTQRARTEEYKIQGFNT